MASFRAELLLLRRRAATWILLAVAILMTLLFSYALPYSAYLSAPAAGRTAAALAPLLPARVVSSVLGGFPFYFGTLTLILGVLAFGSEYGWDTLKTALMQRPGRLRLLAAKLAALGVVLALFTVAVFAAGALAGVAVALREGVAVAWPPAADIARAVGAGWLILALWALLGALLAVLSRGTALAIGLGILYALVIEGLISGFGAGIPLLQDVARAFLRTNGYSLIAPLRLTAGAADGPGFFSGPFVDAGQALAVIVGYLVVFAGVTALVLRRRDVA
ncbi:MAG TPA: ABC transporter permease [Thermomicrobiales bacterium]|nr:ABC transporter permease [Thermomicrobiales bacterium]